MTTQIATLLDDWCSVFATAAAVQRHDDDEEDVRAALTADAQGIGSGLDLGD